MFRTTVLALLFVLGFSSKLTIAAQPSGEPGWSSGVVLFGDARKKKDATPILEREYRPLHFYGNTVRRQHYRGTALPSVSDGFKAVGATVTRR